MLIICKIDSNVKKVSDRNLVTFILNYKYLLEIIRFKFSWITTDVVN